MLLCTLYTRHYNFVASILNKMITHMKLICLLLPPLQRSAACIGHIYHYRGT